jgi:hypothetical protein
MRWASVVTGMLYNIIALSTILYFNMAALGMAPRIQRSPNQIPGQPACMYNPLQLQGSPPRPFLSAKVPVVAYSS